MQITTPLTDEVVERLRAGDKVTLSGVIYVARDAAHKRFVEALDRGEPLPGVSVDLTTVRGPWPDENWKGWWGDEPPYHVPVHMIVWSGL